MIVENTTFRLRPGVDEEAFLRADERVQQDATVFRRGFVRRTTARAPDGEWLVQILWAGIEDAEAAGTALASHPAGAAFWELVDESTVVTRRYQTLD